jgi:hypothetical protein
MWTKYCLMWTRESIDLSDPGMGQMLRKHLWTRDRNETGLYKCTSLLGFSAPSDMAHFAVRIYWYRLSTLGRSAGK